MLVLFISCNDLLIWRISFFNSTIKVAQMISASNIITNTIINCAAPFLFYLTFLKFYNAGNTAYNNIKHSYQNYFNHIVGSHRAVIAKHFYGHRDIVIYKLQ